MCLPVTQPPTPTVTSTATHTATETHFPSETGTNTHTTPPSPPPVPSQPNCVPFQYKKQCEESGQEYAVFTDYADLPVGVSPGTCLPCRQSCNDGCQVSAVVSDAPHGAHVIQYFFSSDCSADTGIYFNRAVFSPDASNTCVLDLSSISCGFVGPITSATDPKFDISSSVLSDDDDDDSSALSSADGEGSFDTEFESSSDEGSHNAEASASSSAEASSSASVSLKSAVFSGACTFTPANGAPCFTQNFALVSIAPNTFVGVEIYVPAQYEVVTGDVYLLNPSLDTNAATPCVQCPGLKLPIPAIKTCPNVAPPMASMQSIGGFVHALGAIGAAVISGLHGLSTAAPAIQQTCLQPQRISASQDAMTQLSIAIQWADLADARLAALGQCNRTGFTSSALQTIDLTPSKMSGCDYDACAALLDIASSLAGGKKPTTQHTLIGRSAQLIMSGKRLLGQQRYTEASNNLCCAEHVIDQVGLATQCSESQMSAFCNMQRISPSNSPARNVPTLVEAARLERKRGDALSKSADSLISSLLSTVALEQCNVSKFTELDNDINDGVTEWNAFSHADTKTWFLYTIMGEPVALGTRDDVEIDLRFSSAHLKDGGRVYVTRLGEEASDDCFTVNSVLHATPDCPSVSFVKLFMSMRAALAVPRGPKVYEQIDVPYINTLVNHPQVAASHMTIVTYVPPAATTIDEARAVTLDFELRVRSRESAGHSCVVRTNGLRSDGHGYAVLVPTAQFVNWPREGVPAFMPTLTDGICVGGDDGGLACDEKQECPMGYCIADANDEKGQQWRCFDSPDAGENPFSECSKLSECPYGTCYGYAGSAQLGAYPTLKTWRMCFTLGCYTDAVKPTGSCTGCFTDEVVEWFKQLSLTSNTVELYQFHE
jgi:hypothetical protein